MKKTIQCSCGELLMKADSDKVKVRGKVFIVKEEGTVYTVCKGCNAEVLVPMELKKAFTPRLFIKEVK